MKSKKSAARATGMASLIGLESGPEAVEEGTTASKLSTQAASTATLPARKALQQQDVASTTLPAAEAFTPEETVLHSTGAISDAALQSTQPPQQCNIATVLLEELQAELRQL